MTINASTPSNVFNSGISLTSPDWQRGDISLVCIERWNETHDVVSFKFQAEKPVKFQFKPGQFLTFSLDVAGEQIFRSYTISSSPSRPYSIVITIKKITDGLISNYLFDNLKVGQKISAVGPDGAFNILDIKAEKYLFISAGSGITPMYSMSRWLTDTQVGTDIAFLHCTRTPEDFIFGESLLKMEQRHPQFKLSLMFEEGRERLSQSSTSITIETGLISQATLERMVPDFASRTVFVCGPAPFMIAVKNQLTEVNFNMDNYYEESFGGQVLAETEQAQQGDSQSAFMLTVGDKQQAVSTEQSILEGVEAMSLPIVAACRSGVCGACKCQVIEGDVESSSQMTLTPEEIEQGYVLTCSTKLKSDVKLVI